ncbi:MAG: TonB-dependent receptor plug domain-containing protein [Methylophilus sp.]|uniref:TonB-dependent receptor plug domain-containing protein n=1 Tax=Methylophilus sp. TaxID=29541 RepID=UPI003F9F1215
MAVLHHKKIAGIIACLLGGTSAQALAEDNNNSSNVFTLGQITVTGNRDSENPLGTATLDREQLWDFGKNGVADALNLIPGVATTMVSGQGRRNESDISLRGLDRTRVPLTIDGIRLFLPADNRIDFSRFLTADLSEIQVAKGYVSVINGPDGMGGAINLVTRKPVKNFEGEVRYSALLGNNGQHDGDIWYANLGGKQEKFYWQASLQQRDIDGWRLSRDYKSDLPATAPNYQGSGLRNFSDSSDWRGSVKLGFTPNETDEYSFNYSKQSGEKRRAPPVRGNDDVQSTGANTRVWDWPIWDTSSLYFLSNTQLGSKTYLKSRAFYNTFNNQLDFYTVAPGGGNRLGTLANSSTYDDNSKGFSVELGTTYFAQQTLKTSLHYRRDEHIEMNTNRLNNSPVAANNNPPEPKQKTVEDIWSLALEDTWHISPTIDLVGGISRDMRGSKQAEEFNQAVSLQPAVLFNLPVKDTNATNYQAAAIWRYQPGGKAHFSVSDRVRFSTIFERYSGRFGTAVSNPGLDPERSRNYELGIEDNLAQGVRGTAAIFHNKIKDYIQQVPNAVFVAGVDGGFFAQNQNVGEATIKGIELGLVASVFPTLEVGGNYSWIDAEISPPPGTVTSYPYLATPKNKGFLYAKWNPTNKWNIVPSYEVADQRWSSQLTGVPGPRYVETGSYSLLNLKVDYRIVNDWVVSFAANNLLDRNYELSAGYPSQGRHFLLSTRYQF